MGWGLEAGCQMEDVALEGGRGLRLESGERKGKGRLEVGRVARIQ